MIDVNEAKRIRDERVDIALTDVYEMIKYNAIRGRSYVDLDESDIDKDFQDEAFGRLTRLGYSVRWCNAGSLPAGHISNISWNTRDR